MSLYQQMLGRTGHEGP